MSIKLSTEGGGKYDDRVAPIKGAIFARRNKKTGFVDIFIPGANICETHHFTEFVNNESQYFSSADSVINYISTYFGIVYDGGGPVPLPEFKTVNNQDIKGVGNIEIIPESSPAWVNAITEEDIASWNNAGSNLLQYNDDFDI